MNNKKTDLWKEITLGELVTFQRGHDLPKSQRKKGKFPVVASKNIVGFHNALKAKSPGVTIGRSGQIGTVQLIEKDYWPLNTTLYSKSFHESDPVFVYYFLKTLDLGKYNSGSAVPTLNRNYIHPLKIKVPSSKKEQEKIGLILYQLDKKIKIFQELSGLMEKILQTLFKSWFIDFDGQTEFVDSEFGQIPKGWNIDNLGSLVNSIKENVKPTKEKDHEKYISLDDMPSNSITLFKHSRGNEVNSSIIRFSKGDILFGNMRPYFHKVGLAQFDGITRTTTFVFRPKKSFFRMFALMHFFSKEVIQYSTLSSIGSTIPYVRWDTLSRYEIVIPPNKMLIRFENTVEPLISKIIENSFLLRNLTKQLNFLIPKLISGEV